MAEINKRNLVDETAKVYAANTLANEPTPLFSTGTPAKIIRASIADTNLLSEDGDLFVGTGDTYTETIDGTEYTYAKIAKKNQSKLFVDGLNSTAKNVGLAANVGKIIDDRLYLTGSTALGTGSIALGYDAKTTNDQAVAIGYMAEAVGGSVAIGKLANASAENAIQLGPGTNSTRNSFQVGLYQMLDLDTMKIPWERINQESLLNFIYPVGSIYMSVNSTNPSMFLGGTWEAWGSGKVPVGVDSLDNDFSVVEKSGGEKTHKLTIDEMPSHIHSFQATPSSDMGDQPYKILSSVDATGASTVRVTNASGGGKPHNNLQSYITCYMWKRTK